VNVNLLGIKQKSYNNQYDYGILFLDFFISGPIFI